MKKLYTHLIFFLILEIVYIGFSVVYSREIDLLTSNIWNLVLALILFCINLMKERMYKWICIAIICVVHLILAIMGIVVRPLEGDMVYLLAITAHVNTPFLPQFILGTRVNMLMDAMYYMLFFYGAMLYWYVVYRLSKKIVH